MPDYTNKNKQQVHNCGKSLTQNTKYYITKSEKSHQMQITKIQPFMTKITMTKGSRRTYKIGKSIWHFPWQAISPQWQSLDETDKRSKWNLSRKHISWRRPITYPNQKKLLLYLIWAGIITLPILCLTRSGSCTKEKICNSKEYEMSGNFKSNSTKSLIRRIEHNKIESCKFHELAKSNFDWRWFADL